MLMEAKIDFLIWGWNEFDIITSSKCQLAIGMERPMRVELVLGYLHKAYNLASKSIILNFSTGFKNKLGSRTFFSWLSSLMHSSFFCSKLISRLFSLLSFFRVDEAREEAFSFRSNTIVWNGDERTGGMKKEDKQHLNLMLSALKMTHFIINLLWRQLGNYLRALL